MTQTTTSPTIPLKNRKLAAFLAFLVPGLGHAYQGRYGKALLYCLSIYSLFFIGMALGHGRTLYWRWTSPIADAEKFCFWYFGQVFTGIVALPALLQATLHHFGKPPILWGYAAEPLSDQINGLYPRFGKLVEMSYIYTEVAGLLNILAIFDAHEGPAIRDEPESKDAPTLDASATAPTEPKS